MLNQATTTYLQKLKNSDWFCRQDPEAPKIHVDYVASRIATLYEKLRQVIDFQEDHLLRRNAINRGLKRRLFLTASAKEISQPLIEELIRGGYFPNNKIPEAKIAEAETIVGKTLLMLNYLNGSAAARNKRELSGWIKDIASCELEELLSPPLKEKALLSYMVEIMAESIEIEDSRLNEEEKNLQIFIACQKCLLKSDWPLIYFRLFKYYEPDWAKKTKEEIKELADRLENLKVKIDRLMSADIGRPLLRFVSRNITQFLLISDVALVNINDAEELFSKKPEELEMKIVEAYKNRHRACQMRVKRSGIRSVISILLSKMAITFLAEIPVDLYITKKFSLPVLGINLATPPFLMFLIAASIKAPDFEKTSPLVLEKTIKTIRPSQNHEPKKIRPPKPRTVFLDIFLGLFFLLVSAAVFYLISRLLLSFDFSNLSVLIFFAFVSLIAFSGVKTRQWARELNVEAEKETVFRFLFDIVSLPFIQAGKWLSGELKKYNILILLLNLFFEAPLQTLFEFIDSWNNYLKEKKEGLE